MGLHHQVEHADRESLDDRELEIKQAKDLIRGLTSICEVENRMLHKDEDNRWFLSHGEIGLYTLAKPCLMIGSATDITELEFAEEAEWEADQMVRALIQSSPIAIIANDLDEKVRVWNPAAERIFGWTKQEILGHSYPLIPAEQQEEKTTIVYRTLKGEMLNGLETYRQKKDGSMIKVAIWTSPLRDAKGEINGVMGVVMDLTERKLAEEKLLRQVQEVAVLGERNRMAQEIHDTIAQGFTQIVLQLEAAEQAMDKKPGKASSHINLAKKLARESLQEARRSVWNLLPKPLELCTLETALEDEVSRFAATGPKDARFAATGTRQDLPPHIQATLLRICQEALTNVRKHAQATQIKVALSFFPSAVCLTIKDNGVGFDPAETKIDKKGKGFGLTSMEQRVDSLGGIFIMRSGKAKGTLVEARIPI